MYSTTRGDTRRHSERPFYTQKVLGLSSALSTFNYTNSMTPMVFSVCEVGAIVPFYVSGGKLIRGHFLWEYGNMTFICKIPMNIF